jgi:hypothetical protein
MAFIIMSCTCVFGVCTFTVLSHLQIELELKKNVLGVISLLLRRFGCSVLNIFD